MPTQTPRDPRTMDNDPVVLLYFDDFADLLPIPLSLPQALRRSYRDKFPRALRFGSIRSKPMFGREPVIQWVRDTFKDACPELVSDFESEILKVKGTRLALRGDRPKRSSKNDKGRK